MTYVGTAAAAAIQEERERWDLLKQLVRDNAKDIAYVWSSGDGCGGGLLEMIAETLNEVGYPCETEGMMTARRRAAKPPKDKIPPWLRKKVFERDHYRCLRCGTHIDLSIDHIVPESRGGTSTETNLQTLCRSCNASKGVGV